MENDIEQARASNMEEDKASSPNKGKYIDEGNASDIEMATNIVEKLDNEMRVMSSEQNSSEKRMYHCCIYRVPKPLCDGPQLISIGPLHRGNERLEAMKKDKLKYFKKLTERDGMDKKKKCDIVISIKNEEERLRYCYSEKFDEIKSNDFVEMILLDAVFIILFLLESNDEKGPRNFNPKKTSEIREDLMLIENQLPFFIIEKIYDQVGYNSSDNKPKSFLDLATCYSRKHLPLQVVETSPGVEKETSSSVEKETISGLNYLLTILRSAKRTRHLTDLLRDLMLRRALRRRYSSDIVKLKYSAIMLRKAGVRFQVTRDECLVNITFDKGVLKIPHLKVDHNFERLVRNIMAMEQCLYERKAYICSYIKFMGQLIDSAEDVGLLVRKGIIVHRLGDDAAVSNMITDLCENIGDIKCTCFGDISTGLNAHFESPFNNAIATLVLGYFPDIWRGTATVAAALLLILTFIQTISSVKSFY